MSNWLPQLTASKFLLWGAICALAPILIHLLNHLRFRTVEWAAMDLLRQALQRSRRMMRIRDILLMALRTAAILLFGLALAQPYFSPDSEQFDQSQPLHAVLVIDNSLSMAYDDGQGPLLTRAKQRAEQFIERLPAGSRVTIKPLVGSREPIGNEPYRTTATALEALERIEVVDRPASFLSAVELAREARDTGGAELARRVVLFTDQQTRNWSGKINPEAAENWPDLQVVAVAPDKVENSWIADFRLRDGVADVETPATFVVRVRHQGDSPRRDLQVTLSIDGKAVDSKVVTIEPAAKGRPGEREIVFHHEFRGVEPEPGKPVFVAATASIDLDRLPADNERSLAVPVVKALPVVFLDQFGSDEDPGRLQYGETWSLRRMLAPRVRGGQGGAGESDSSADRDKHLIRVRHKKINEVNQDLLRDARLVVIAGVADPGPASELLRQYVEQGGRLLVAAGGDVRASAWNDGAWRRGEGWLPLPIQPRFLGETPTTATAEETIIFEINEKSLDDRLFRIPGYTIEELTRLYRSPTFFKAVVVDETDEPGSVLRARLRRELVDLAESVLSELDRNDNGNSSAADSSDMAGEASELDWLLWADSQQTDSPRAVARRELRELLEELRGDDSLQDSDLAQFSVIERQASGDPEKRYAAEDVPPALRALDRKIRELVDRQMPRVLGRYDVSQADLKKFGLSGPPAFAVERRLGRGRVVMLTSGLYSRTAPWNDLHNTAAMSVLDHVARTLLESTLPGRNYEPQMVINVPIASGGAELALQRPGSDEREYLGAGGYIRRDVRGVTIRGALSRGVYHLVGYSQPPAGSSAPPIELWKTPVVVRGDPDESELTPLSREQFERDTAGLKVRWVGPGEEINLAGSQIRGANLWWWLILAVLLILLVEMTLLAFSRPAAAPVVAQSVSMPPPGS